MIIGQKIYHKKKVYNSIEWAKSEIDAAPSGAVFFADVHEFTRGRQGRIWQQYPGQLLVTALLKPRILDQINKKDLELRLNQLNMTICLAVLQPLKEFGIGLKWPNDYVFSGKKVGGLLFDLVWQADKLLGIIFAFAINVNNVIPESDEIYKIATSLGVILKKELDEKELFKKFLESLDKFYEKWLNFEFNKIYDLWKSEQVYLGENIKIHKKDGSVVQGKFVDLLKNGDLVLECDGKKETVSFYIIENLSI